MGEPLAARSAGAGSDADSDADANTDASAAARPGARSAAGRTAGSDPAADASSTGSSAGTESRARPGARSDSSADDGSSGYANAALWRNPGRSALRHGVLNRRDCGQQGHDRRRLDWRPRIRRKPAINGSAQEALVLGANMDPKATQTAPIGPPTGNTSFDPMSLFAGLRQMLAQRPQGPQRPQPPAAPSVASVTPQTPAPANPQIIGSAAPAPRYPSAYGVGEGAPQATEIATSLRDLGPALKALRGRMHGGGSGTPGAEGGSLGF